MESLALVVVIVLFTALIGGPTALLLTYMHDVPKPVRIMKTVMVCLLALLGILFGFQLTVGSSIPLVPKLVGIIGLITAVAALLYEFKILRRKSSSSKDLVDSINGNSETRTYAVIFKSKRQDANSDLYYQHNNELVEKIKSLAGYLKHTSVRNPETREGITVAYFDSLEAIDQWRKDEDHMAAKNLAKSHFYENYSIEITEVVESYGWAGN